MRIRQKMQKTQTNEKREREKKALEEGRFWECSEKTLGRFFEVPTWGDWYTPKGWIIPAGRWTVPAGCENCYLRNITKVLSYAKYCAKKYPEIEVAIGQLEVAIERIAWLNMPALKEAMACLKDKSQRDEAFRKIDNAIKAVKQNTIKKSD